MAKYLQIFFRSFLLLNFHEKIFSKLFTRVSLKVDQIPAYFLRKFFKKISSEIILKISHKCRFKSGSNISSFSSKIFYRNQPPNTPMRGCILSKVWQILTDIAQKFYYKISAEILFKIFYKCSLKRSPDIYTTDILQYIISWISQKPALLHRPKFSVNVNLDTL